MNTMSHSIIYFSVPTTPLIFISKIVTLQKLETFRNVIKDTVTIQLIGSIKFILKN